ncbi:hypothetical protein XvhCFBP2543_20375 [Xanthomonas vasicola]|nr:hypothetical protein XvhCFBP2543_20375 [Xanthomonas vasicola]
MNRRLVDDGSPYTRSHPPRPSPLPALASRVLQGTRGSDAQTVPSRPGGKGLYSQELRPAPFSHWEKVARSAG